MGRLNASPPVLALLAVATMALAGCGSGSDAKLLPGTTASEIDSNLSLVEQQVAEEECVGAENSAAEIGSQVEELTGVDAKLKQALAEGASRLTENVAAECEEEPEEATVPTIEENEEAEPDEKPKHEKPKEAKKEPAEAPETKEGPELPPQANGKGEEKGNGEAPPEETPSEAPESPSGGVGPGVPAEEGD
jgi:hypothetical protein